MNKVYPLKEAVATFVEDGDALCFGGFTTNRKSYAVVHEILRQKQKDLIGYGGPAGGDWDLLIGAGRVKAYINCYTANSGVTNVSRRFRAAIEKGQVLFEDYSQDVVMLMLHTASLGLPYFTSRLMMGTDITDKWGISEEIRKTIPKLPDKKFAYVESPFNGDPLVAVPTPVIDTAVIHVQQASPDGTCRILGDEFHDVDIAVAAKKVIVTCEELVENDQIRLDPSQNSLPGFCISAVVHAPYGAHPSQCYGHYDYDNPYLKEYDVASKTDEAFADFVKKYATGVSSHEEYLDLIGATRLLDLKEVPGYGYATKNVGKED